MVDDRKKIFFLPIKVMHAIFFFHGGVKLLFYALFLGNKRRLYTKVVRLFFKSKYSQI